MMDELIREIGEICEKVINGDPDSICEARIELAEAIALVPDDIIIKVNGEERNVRDILIDELKRGNKLNLDIMKAIGLEP